ncbi:hypothetical protein DOROTHY_91 [Mycobacterium phage Dorothy]|uniref:Uncharacterized protein n=9 Tax=Cheoctovirus TaxID=1623281 RepID=A0A385DXB2_9CAUD|nr:hypothetical protein BOOMER_93 [Mycobacterium phage Boomer]YP_009016167.1 hypothetical protein CL68_gp089 [Mycobacterium phage Drago]YP_009125369.1 hypothetical protein VC69_gp088 [Mycobacterium phage Inventum]YP_009592066.1 hypothetical protein FDG65_gp091 [Mycobacterium phage Dorothy]YP_009954996.1 hypothetical protein I5H17_gp100 [Mycobacterium phage BodEinwohner17]YP_009958330.1 hypothetical protein I5H49_gp093 [Mycobacterium phage JoeyJr]YP_009959046.1 hypothetical protein I5H56_gp093
MTDPNEKMRQEIQAMIQDELMRAWREGVVKGLETAQKMVIAVREEALSRISEIPENQREALQAQIAVLSGLADGIEISARQAAEPNQEGDH